MSRALELEVRDYVPHWLHGKDRNWPETNCYTDLWIEVVASIGYPPEAMFGFTLTQDFEGDQFTFFKPPQEDLEALFGLIVAELAIFDRLDEQAELQLSRGRLLLAEVDGYYLPDTVGLSYRRQHVKTTIGINDLDIPARRLGYFHNGGYFEISGEDYDGVFGRLPYQAERNDALPPYVEFVKGIELPVAADRLFAIAEQRLSYHLRRMPETNPLAQYSESSAAHQEMLLARGSHFFDVYAFNTVRQLGANFDLLGVHLDWIGNRRRFETAIVECQRISEGAKTMLFQLARCAARGRPVELRGAIDAMADSYDAIINTMVAELG